MISGLLMYLCRSGNDNIRLLCTAGGTDELRRDGRVEMGEQLLASLVAVTAQHYLRAERASDIHLAAHPRAGHHHKPCWNLPAFIQKRAQSPGFCSDEDVLKQGMLQW